MERQVFATPTTSVTGKRQRLHANGKWALDRSEIRRSVAAGLDL
jgi:hypothetical protein